jgi:hypothetical protein
VRSPYYTPFPHFSAMEPLHERICRIVDQAVLLLGKGLGDLQDSWAATYVCCLQSACGLVSCLDEGQSNHESVESACGSASFVKGKLRAHQCQTDHESVRGHVGRGHECVKTQEESRAHLVPWHVSSSHEDLRSRSNE